VSAKAFSLNGLGSDKLCKHYQILLAYPTIIRASLTNHILRHWPWSEAYKPSCTLNRICVNTSKHPSFLMRFVILFP